MELAARSSISVLTEIKYCDYVCQNSAVHSYTGLFEMIVGVLTTCHKQYT